MPYHVVVRDEGQIVDVFESESVRAVIKFASAAVRSKRAFRSAGMWPGFSASFHHGAHDKQCRPSWLVLGPQLVASIHPHAFEESDQC